MPHSLTFFPASPRRETCLSPSSRLFPTVSHAERTSTLRSGYEPLGGELVLGSRAVACWNNATEDFGLQMSDMPARCGSRFDCTSWVDQATFCSMNKNVSTPGDASCNVW